MEPLHQIAGAFWSLFIQNPIAFICAIIMLIYVLRGMGWHAMYAYALLIGIYAVIETVGISEFIAGVIVGVVANEIFRIFREKLEKERKPGP